MQELLDYGVLPPEINSGRMYAGPGPGPMLAAARAWQDLASELTIAAAGCSAVVADVTTGPWTGGSSSAMAAAVAPYVAWLEATAIEVEQTVGQINAAVGAYEAARAGTVPPALIAANRDQLAALAATNVVGQNTPAIAATEMLYAEMWAQDAAAMYGYAAASVGAAQVAPFTSPPQQITALAAQALAGNVNAANGTHASLAAHAHSASGKTTQAHSASATGLPLTINPAAALQMAVRMAPMGLMYAMQVVRSLSLATTGRPKSMVRAATGTGARAAGTVPARLAGGGTAATAGLGRAGSIGKLSVPLAWGMAGSASAAAAATPVGSTSVAPVTAGGLPGMAPMGLLHNSDHGGVRPAAHSVRGTDRDDEAKRFLTLDDAGKPASAPLPRAVGADSAPAHSESPYSSNQ